MFALNTALYTKLDTDRQSVVAGSLGVLGVLGVYDKLAPQGQAMPFVTFHKQAGDDTYRFGGRAWRTFLYLVKSVSQGESSKTGNDIAERLDALLTDSGLAVTGYTTMLIQRESDIDYDEVDGGERYHHIGALYRILLDPA